jgi:alkylhydroperoxidase/carboxymuconolactone decarboxylase family protein YurZ
MNHLRYARNLGITENEMREIIIQVGYYAGWPKGAHAMARFTKILNDPKSGWRKPQKRKIQKEPTRRKA